MNSEYRRQRRRQRQKENMELSLRVLRGASIFLSRCIFLKNGGIFAALRRAEKKEE